MEADLQPAQIHLTSAKLYVKPVLVTDVSANTLCDEAEISTLSAIKRGNAFQTSDVPVKKTKLSQRGPAVDKQVGAMCRILPPLNTSGLLLLVNCSFMNHEDIKPRVICDKDVYETAIILNSLSNDNYCDQQLTIPSKENCIWYNLELDGFLTDISEEGSSQTDFDLMMCEIEKNRQNRIMEPISYYKDADQYFIKSSSLEDSCSTSSNESTDNDLHHAAYGTRFNAEMPDGSYKESHISEDLKHRAVISGGKYLVDILTVRHLGEIDQLETAWSFIEKSKGLTNSTLVLAHLRSLKMDSDFRNGGRINFNNASNLFKRAFQFGERRKSDPNYLKL